MSFIIPLSEVSIPGVALVGGKASALGTLIQAGFQVPNGFVITTQAFEYFIRANHIAYSDGYVEFMRRSSVRRASAKQIAEGMDRFDSDAILDIIDIGCNDGAMTQLYLEQLFSINPARAIRIRLVEPAPDALTVAAKRLTGLQGIEVSSQPTTLEAFLGEEPPPADIVCMLWVFYHLDVSFVAPLLKLVRPGGGLLIAMGGPNHPIRTPGVLASSAKHGGHEAVEAELRRLGSLQQVLYEREEVPTEIDLRGLWSEESGMTPAGVNFFSFMFNVDYENFKEEVRLALDLRLKEIFQADGGIARHSHYLYWVSAA